jgi:hypothetical protein
VTLLNAISDIRAGIKSGNYRNEAAVSQGIVLRLLQALGWSTFDTHIVCPEFALSGRRVDYALCHPADKPVAFIEVKQLGLSSGAERQLFEYAFHVGVPLAILTDGQEWNFFLPAEQGDYSERRVYKLDILERDLSESVSRFDRYLSYSRISSGAALTAAREDYHNISRNRQMISALPDAWSKLVSEEDDLLLELLADKVANLCGFKPDLDTIAKFLRERVTIKPGPTSNTSTIPGNPLDAVTDRTTTPEPPKRLVPPTAAVPQTSIGYSLDGRFKSCRNGRDILISVFETLSERDAHFLERFAARPKHGRTRRYIARTPEELYPGRQDLADEHSIKLKSGWYLGTNVSHAQIEHIIEMACEVANLKFGRELVVNVRGYRAGKSAEGRDLT